MQGAIKNIQSAERRDAIHFSGRFLDSIHLGFASKYTKLRKYDSETREGKIDQPTGRLSLGAATSSVDTRTFQWLPFLPYNTLKTFFDIRRLRFIIHRRHIADCSCRVRCTLQRAEFAREIDRKVVPPIFDWTKYHLTDNEIQDNNDISLD